MDTLIGFDSAWTNNAKAPGAICAIQRHATGDSTFYPPKLTSFEGALQFISEIESDAGITLIALDQPTIVSNSQGKRPVESAVSPLMGWIGGAVQPSNRSRLGMFCDASPIWPFLSQLQALEEPEKARVANKGRYLIEVFPALAMPSLDETFFGRLKAPKYNPERKISRSRIGVKCAKFYICYSLISIRKKRASGAQMLLSLIAHAKLFKISLMQWCASTSRCTGAFMNVQPP